MIWSVIALGAIALYAQEYGGKAAMALLISTVFIVGVIEALAEWRKE